MYLFTDKGEREKSISRAAHSYGVSLLCPLHVPVAPRCGPGAGKVGMEVVLERFRAGHRLGRGRGRTGWISAAAHTRSPFVFV